MKAEDGARRLDALFRLGRRYKYAALVLLAGLLLLLWPAGDGAQGGGKEAPGAMEIDVSDLERRLERALGQVEGVGQATVVLTLKSGPQRVLATNVRRDADRLEQSAVVLSQGGGSQEAVTLQEYCPQFQGALVVCEGGESPGVQLRVLKSVSALTGLSADKISICGRK